MIRKLFFFVCVVFELWKGVIGLNNQVFVDMYVALIIAKRRTIEQVPAHLQEAVLADLAAIGLDGYGNPLPQEPQEP